MDQAISDLSPVINEITFIIYFKIKQLGYALKNNFLKRLCPGFTKLGFSV